MRLLSTGAANRFLGTTVSCLLTRATVDALTQQICVADVSRVLLNEVRDDVAGFYFVSVDIDGVVEVEVHLDLLSV